MPKKSVTKMRNAANGPVPPAPVKEETEEVTAPSPIVPVPVPVAVKVEVPETPTPLPFMVVLSDKEPSFGKYVNDLRGLSPAISIFLRRFNELEKHLDFIQNAIDSLSEQIPTDNGAEVVVPNAAATSSPDASIPVLDEPTVRDSANDESSRDTFRSTLEYLSYTMGSRGLRKYIASHLSDLPKLREEAPPALKRAPNLAKLVLECIGRFYLQGSKAFSRDSPMIAVRQASFLILEFFLLAGCTHIEQSVQQEAEVAALAWRKRLIGEGGVSSATSADARGLLLFVASYGIPFEFGNEDLIDLIRLSNPLEIADALRQSPFLPERVPDVIQGMIKSGMFVAAVDTVFTFGLQDKFPPQTILTSFLRESKEAWKKARGESQGAPLKLKEANEKQLAAFKSIIRCLEEHKIDPTVLAGWNISLKVANLENDISDLDKIIEERTISKRNIEDHESSKKLRPQDGKRLRSTAGVSPHISSTVMLSQEQSTVCLATGKSLYDAGFSVVLDGYSGAPPRTNYASSSTSGAGVLPGATLGNMGLITGVSSGRGALPPTVSVPGIGGFRPFIWHGDGALRSNFIEHNLMGPPASTVRSSFGPALGSDQGFLGQPSTSLGAGNQGSGTDLYQFADTVLDGELKFNGSSQMGIRGLAAAAGHPYRSSYHH